MRPAPPRRGAKVDGGFSREPTLAADSAASPSAGESSKKTTRGEVKSEERRSGDKMGDGGSREGDLWVTGSEGRVNR